MQEIIGFIQELGPWGVFTFLVLCSFGLPIAKSLLLLLAGLLANQYHNVPLFFLAAVLGLHGGDFALFMIGWVLDDRLFKIQLVQKIFSQKKIEQAKKLISEKGLYSLVIIRLTPYIRGVCYLMLGSLKMSIWRFSLINILVSSIYTLFFFVPGYYLVNQLEHLKHISHYANTILGILFALLLVGIYFKWQQRKKRENTANP